MATENKDQPVHFMDRIWLQFGLATGITVLWLVWIIFEILVKEAPGA